MSKSVFDSTLSKHLVMDDIDANNAVAKFPARYSFDPLPAAATDPFSITVGASPFAFSNRTAGKVEVMISGGTVSSITHIPVFRQVSLLRRYRLLPIPRLPLSLRDELTSSGDTITVTYSVAPTMAAVPHA